jgi:hypothetical protein
MTEGTLYSFDSAQFDAEELCISPFEIPTKSSYIAEHHQDTVEDSPVSFVGRSGKTYKAQPATLEKLRIRDDQVCLLSVSSSKGEDVVWVGSGQSLVHDQPNRAEFMDVVNKADKAYIIDIEDLAAQSLISWDLTRTHHELPRAA